MNTEWKPIESAPKDESDIWAFNGEQGRMQWSEGDGWALWVWSDPILSDVDPAPDQPTHWMPLPPAPTSHPIPTGATGEEQVEMTDEEQDELLGCVSACQSAYHIDSTPGHRFGGLPSALEENRAAVIEFVNDMLASRRPAPAAGDALDAARWRAFIGCARIRPLGSAGLEQPDPNHYAHMGLEIWTVYGRDYSPELLERMDAENERGRRWLVMFADVARAAIAQQSQRKEA